MSTRIKVQMKPVNVIVNRLGLSRDGDVQMQLTRIVNQRITRYMPYRSSALATKSKIMAKEDSERLSEGKKSITNPTTITVQGPYAKYQYYGNVMVGTKPKIATDKPLTYSKHKHPLAGPKWDQRMMAAEGKQIVRELQEYVDRRKR